MKLPAKFDPSDVTAIMDSREQIGVDLSPLRVVTRTLNTGDYSIVGMESEIAVELKGSIGDLLACVGTDRERFSREVVRLKTYPVRALVCVTSWDELERGEWRSRVTSNSVIGSLLGWQAGGLPVMLVDDRAMAGRVISRILFTAARRQYRSTREMLKAKT